MCFWEDFSKSEKLPKLQTNVSDDARIEKQSEVRLGILFIQDVQKTFSFTHLKKICLSLTYLKDVYKRLRSTTRVLLTMKVFRRNCTKYGIEVYTLRKTRY